MAAENLYLRQQVASLSRKNPRPKLTKRDRIFWVWMLDVQAWVQMGGSSFLCKAQHREAMA